MMDVSTIQTEIVHVGEGIAEDSSSMIDGRDTFDEVAVEVAVVVLGEVDEVGGAMVVDSDVDAWKLVETDIMISYCTYYRHEIAKCGSESTIHAEEVIPGIGAGRHVIIIRDVPADKEDIRLQRGCNFG